MNTRSKNSSRNVARCGCSGLRSRLAAPVVVIGSPVLPVSSHLRALHVPRRRAPEGLSEVCVLVPAVEGGGPSAYAEAVTPCLPPPSPATRWGSTRSPGAPDGEVGPHCCDLSGEPAAGRRGGRRPALSAPQILRWEAQGGRQGGHQSPVSASNRTAFVPILQTRSSTRLDLAGSLTASHLEDRLTRQCSRTCWPASAGGGRPHRGRWSGSSTRRRSTGKTTPNWPPRSTTVSIWWSTPCHLSSA
jgi:hypothetical protein